MDLTEMKLPTFPAWHYSDNIYIYIYFLPVVACVRVVLGVRINTQFSPFLLIECWVGKLRDKCRHGELVIFICFVVASLLMSSESVGGWLITVRTGWVRVATAILFDTSGSERNF